MKTKPLQLLGVLLLLVASTLASAAPSDIRIEYTLLRNGQPVGKTVDTYHREGTAYRIDSETAATGAYAIFARGKIRLHSEGEVTDAGLKPTKFEHQRGSDPAKTAAAEFDWDKGELTLKSDGKSETVPLASGTQDRLSLQYQFLFLPKKAKELVRPMTNGRKVTTFTYRLVDKPTLATPAGRLRTLHFAKEHKPEEGSAEIWIAPARSNVPVRIIIEDNGEKLEQVLSSVEIK